MAETLTCEGITYKVGDEVVVTGPIIMNQGEHDQRYLNGTQGVITSIAEDEEEFTRVTGRLCVRMHTDNQPWWFKPGFNIAPAKPPTPIKFAFMKRGPRKLVLS